MITFTLQDVDQHAVVDLGYLQFHQIPLQQASSPLNLIDCLYFYYAFSRFNLHFCARHLYFHFCDYYLNEIQRCLPSHYFDGYDHYHVGFCYRIYVSCQNVVNYFAHRQNTVAGDHDHSLYRAQNVLHDAAMTGNCYHFEYCHWHHMSDDDRHY